jgi:hypothetical protein
MPVTEGRKGLVTVCFTATGQQTVAEIGEWNISGMTLPMIEYAAFGDTVTRFKPGIMNPGEFTFSGYLDGSSWAAPTAVSKLFDCLNNGYPILANTTVTSNTPLRDLRLWANNDSNLESFGFWGTSESSGTVYITGAEIATAKDGIGTINFSGKIAQGRLEWSTSTA